jgi:hypothetical protein
MLLAACAALFGAEVIKNSDCLQCHEDKTLTKTNAQGREISLFVDAGLLTNSVHRANLCVNCHPDITGKHPDDEVPARSANCIGCHESQAGHEKAAQEYAASIHGSSHTQGALAAATCGDCHGNHAIIPVRNPGSPVFKLNLANT